jgi:PAS domain S-box-containing protein
VNERSIHGPALDPRAYEPSPPESPEAPASRVTPPAEAPDDVDAEERAVQRLQHRRLVTERRLRSVIAASADAIVVADEALRIVLVNPAAGHIFGYRADEMLDEPVELLFPEIARLALRSQLDHFARTPPETNEMGERGRLWGRRSSGELFPIEASVSKHDAGGGTEFTLVLRDVTQRHRAEKERETLIARDRAMREAAEAAEHRAAFLSNASDLLHSSLAVERTFASLTDLLVPALASCCVIDVVEESGRVRRAHVKHDDPSLQPWAERLRGYPRDQTRYLTRRAIVEGISELLPTVSDEHLQSVAEDDRHLELLRTLSPRSMIITPLHAHGRVLGAIVLARGAGEPAYGPDDLAFAEQLAQRAASALANARLYAQARRAVRARDDVLSVVSHDLRNPLGVISMCASSLLAEGFADEARDRGALQTIERSARWAQRLIQDLLDVSAIEAGGLSLERRAEDPLILAMRATMLHEELAAERGLSLASDVPERLPPVLVDADRVVQALGNLIGNACKFTPRGGTVRVSAEQRGDSVRFAVTDSGPGVSAEDAPHVFDRFWTVRRSGSVRGTGMGLAIVRGVAEAHGGRAWLEPGTGTGATFCFSVPVVV